jgi:nitrogen fixation/metabolism regulation signal transduction histidine kinase
MKNLKALLGLFILSFLAIIVTGMVLNYLGIEHGPLLIKIGTIFTIVNIILYLLLLIFFVCKNLLNVYTEKKRKEIGSKFRTKLIVSFLGLVLTPSVLLFILSHQLIDNSIDTWFSLEVQKPIYDSMDIAKTLYFRERQNAGNLALLLASDLNLLKQSSKKDSHTGKFNSYLIKKPDNTTLVKEAFKGASGTDIFSTDKGDIIRAVSPVRDGDRITGVVVVETIIQLQENGIHSKGI